MKSLSLSLVVIAAAAFAGDVPQHGEGQWLPYNGPTDGTSAWSPGSPDIPWTTSVVYTTSEVTISSCALDVTDCPYKHKPTVVTSTIPAYTTICPVSSIETPLLPSSFTSAVTAPVIPPTPVAPTSSPPTSIITPTIAPSTSVTPIPPPVVAPISVTPTHVLSTYVPPLARTATLLTTSTVYTASEATVSSCAPEVTNCPYNETPTVITITIPAYTAICPVTPAGKLTISTSQPVIPWTYSIIRSSSQVTVSSPQPTVSWASIPIYTTFYPSSGTEVPIPVPASSGPAVITIPGSPAPGVIPSTTPESPSTPDTPSTITYNQSTTPSHTVTTFTGGARKSKAELLAAIGGLAAMVVLF